MVLIFRSSTSAESSAMLSSVKSAKEVRRTAQGLPSPALPCPHDGVVSRPTELAGGDEGSVTGGEACRLIFDSARHDTAKKQNRLISNSLNTSWKHISGCLYMSNAVAKYLYVSP